MTTVCIDVVALHDRGLLEAVASLARQERSPDRIRVVASPPLSEEMLREVRARSAPVPIEFVRAAEPAAGGADRTLPGEDVTVFFDAGGVAPAGWLARLIAPVEAGQAAYSAGPIRPLRPSPSPVERDVVLRESSIYEELVPRGAAHFPGHNSAWRTSTLRELGFESAPANAAGDDLEARAARAGVVGVFVPQAWAYLGTSETAAPRARRRPPDDPSDRPRPS